MRNFRVPLLVVSTLVVFAGAFFLISRNELEVNPVNAAKSGDVGAAHLGAAVPSTRGKENPAFGRATPQVQSVFDSRDDLLAVAKLVLALDGANSREYAAAFARIGEACDAASSAMAAPKDQFGAHAPTYDASRILMQRCLRWAEQVGSLPAPGYETSELMGRAVSEVTFGVDGLGTLSPDSAVVRDAIHQIRDGQHASEFLEAITVWFDAHPEVRASLTSRNRLTDDDLLLALTFGARLLECEIASSCGPRSFATLETCVHTGCSPDLSYWEALRTSLSPRVVASAVDFRNLLAAIRSAREAEATGSP